MFVAVAVTVGVLLTVGVAEGVVVSVTVEVGVRDGRGVGVSGQVVAAVSTLTDRPSIGFAPGARASPTAKSASSDREGAAPAVWVESDQVRPRPNEKIARITANPSHRERIIIYRSGCSPPAKWRIA